jgi:hypothetical protein
MSERIDEIASVARAAAADAVWRQWGALGAPVAGANSAPRSVIDPEALLLLSASIRSSERRLDDVLGWWAAAGSTLLSVQRSSRRRPKRGTAGGARSPGRQAMRAWRRAGSGAASPASCPVQR